MAPSSNGKTAEPVGKAPVPSAVGLELGEVGLKEQRGVIHEEWMRALKGDRGREVYRQMADNDPVVGASLYGLRQLIRRAEWSTRPPDNAENLDPDMVEEDVQFAESLRHDMSHSWEALIDEIMSGMPVYGWQTHEVVLKQRAGQLPDTPGQSSRYSDGLIGWRKMALRKQATLSRWQFDDTGGLAGMWQRQEEGGEVFIPIEKLGLFRTTQAGGNPEGRSALRNAYRPWWYKTRIEDYESIGIERDLTGIPHFELPEELLDPNATGGQRAALETFKTMGRNLRRDEQSVILTPLAYDERGNKRYNFELVSSPGSAHIDTTPVLTRHNQSIAMSLLADVILLGHEKVGTQALAVSKTDLLAASLDAWLQGIAEVFNRHLLPRIFSVNGKATGDLPQYVPAAVQPDDVNAIVEQINKLAQAGVPLFPDTEIEEWLAERVGYPAPDVEAREAALLDSMNAGMDPAAVAVAADGAPLADPDAISTDPEMNKAMDVAQLIQKIYLGVDKVITADEARVIANRAGAGLVGDFEKPPAPAMPPAMVAEQSKPGPGAISPEDDGELDEAASDSGDEDELDDSAGEAQG